MANSKSKIVTILGARPQFIKAGTVSREIAKHVDIEEIIVHTGQHYDTNMSDVFFEEMKIPKPDYHLDINDLSHGAMTGQMLEAIEDILLKEKPDWVLVYGDTNSTLAGALAASKLHIKVAHIEAGLRSFNMQMPEEINRILTDRVSDVLFCPTQTAVENLQKEVFPFVTASGLQQQIIKAGDVMQDGAIFYSSLANKPAYEFSKNFVLCTIHRAENTDDELRLKEIFEALEEITKEVQIVLPLHPRTKQIIQKLKLDIKNLTIIDPVGYLEMIWLIDHCGLVVTDSGGLQKEAFFFKKHCITLRDETEWIELIDNNFNVLAGAEKEVILDLYQNHQFSHDFDMDLYGGGRASKIIISVLRNYK